jgi:hypothetical protein
MVQCYQCGRCARFTVSKYCPTCQGKDNADPKGFIQRNVPVRLLVKDIS